MDDAHHAFPFISPSATDGRSPREEILGCPIEECVATLHLTPTFFPRLTVAPSRQPATGLISISSPRADVAFHLFRTFS